MSLKGNFETFALNSIFQLLCEEQKTGVLQVKSDEKEIKIYFKDGDIIYATGSKKEDLLGYSLQNKGIISKEQLRDALAKGRAEKKH